MTSSMRPCRWSETNCFIFSFSRTRAGLYQTDRDGECVWGSCCGWYYDLYTLLEMLCVFWNQEMQIGFWCFRSRKDRHILQKYIYWVVCPACSLWPGLAWYVVMYWQPGITVRTIILLSCLLCRVKSSNSRQLLCHRQIRFGAQLLYKTRLDGQLISLTLFTNF